MPPASSIRHLLTAAPVQISGAAAAMVLAQNTELSMPS